MWLNPKGVREQTLKNAIQKYYDMIAFNMKKRNQEIAALIAASERSRFSTRRKADAYQEPYQHYTNRWKQ
jgi:hypothetical protein